MTGAVVFLVVVVVAYAILLIRAHGKRVSGKRVIEKVESAAQRAKAEAEVIVAKTMATERRNPFTPKPNVLDYMVPFVEGVIKKIDTAGYDPIMDETVNKGSQKFFEAEERRRADALRGNHNQFRLPGEPPPGVPDDPDLARNLWPKPRRPRPGSESDDDGDDNGN